VPRAQKVAPEQESMSANTQIVTPASVSCGVRRDPKKLNILCLHGTTMSGKSMQGMMRSKQCAVETDCSDIANFYYPTGPCVVSPNHEIFKQAPEAGPPGPDKRHWWTMKDKWDFSEALFADARKVLDEFIANEIGGPVDIVLGYSQGAAATTQVLNEVFGGKWRNENLKCVKGAIFFGCPTHPRPSKSIGGVKSLHCNGNKDPLTKLDGAREHARCFTDSTFFEFDGGHEVKKQNVAPVRKFILSVRAEIPGMGTE